MTEMIVQGVFVLDPEERDRFIEASSEGMRSSRAEEGCLEYVFAADPLEPNRVVLSERWESMSLLRQHMDRQASRPAADRPKPISVDIVMYETASATKLA